MTPYTLTMTLAASCDGPHAPTGPSSSLAQTTLTTATGSNCSLAAKQNNWREELKIERTSSTVVSLSRIGSKSTNLGATQLIHDFKALVLFRAVAPKDKALHPSSQGSQNSGASAIPRVSSVDDLDLLLSEQLIISDCPTIHSCAGPGSSGVGPKRPRSEGSDKQPTGRKKRQPDESNGSNGGSRNGNGNGQDPGDIQEVPNAGEKPSAKRFACPFHKLNPSKYGCCEGFNFTGWDRVLQHLKRKHLVKGEHCPDCRTEFNVAGALAEYLKDEHIRATCRSTTAIESGKLLQIEYEGLMGLGRGSHEDKWYKGWDKLFPQQPRPRSPLVETLFEVGCRNVRETLMGRYESLLRSRGYNLEQTLLMDLVDVAEQSFRDSVTPHLAPAQGPMSMPSLAGDMPWAQPPQVPPAPPGQAVPDLALQLASAGPIPPARPPEDLAPNPSHSGPCPRQSSLSEPEAILSAQPLGPPMQFQNGFLQAQDAFFSQQFSGTLSPGDVEAVGLQPVLHGGWDPCFIWPIDPSLTDTGDTDNNGSCDGLHPHPSQYVN
ncbi:hypothetical protein NW762_011142 [Fusarium torreyae]|uniref:C2H2-type domain-containing protein n=1 Tax=Fusarium torreyae TaxID=1237075 RepID=A0A9W8RTC5_9HYPO|nr:hypothetical protein NW762_011142 [Fusarium torreyae]